MESWRNRSIQVDFLPSDSFCGRRPIRNEEEVQHPHITTTRARDSRLHGSVHYIRYDPIPIGCGAIHCGGFCCWDRLVE